MRDPQREIRTERGGMESRALQGRREGFTDGSGRGTGAQAQQGVHPSNSSDSGVSLPLE